MIASDIQRGVARAVRQLQLQAAIRKMPKTQLASAVGINRNTLARKFDSEDMYISTFIGIARALNEDPIAILASALSSEGGELE